MLATAPITVQDNGATLSAPGLLLADHADGDSYREVPPALRRADLRFLPYAHWGNRGGSEMRVWVRH